MTGSAPVCAHPPCRRKTRDASGRCPDHRTEVGSAVTARLTPPAPVVTERRDASPTVVVTADGRRQEMWRDERGELSRLDGPALLITHADGRPSTEDWYLHGRLHRLGGPASTNYYDSGGLSEQTYSVDGKRHRVDGPAVIGYSDGRITLPEWYLEDEFIGFGDLHATVVEVIRARPATRTIESYFRGSPLHDLFGHDTLTAAGRERSEVVFEAFASGVRTPEGMREVLGGAPVEWVRSWESSRSSPSD